MYILPPENKNEVLPNKELISPGPYSAVTCLISDDGDAG